MPRNLLLPFFLLLLSVLAGCTGGGILSPDVDYDKSRSRHYRTVLRGDTLFSIAWDVGVDFRTLARWNGIGKPYVIRPGQHLRVTRPPAGRAARHRQGPRRGESGSSYYRVRKGDTVYSIAKKTGNRPSRIIAWNRLRKPYTIRPGQKLRIRPTGSAGKAPGTRPGTGASRPPKKGEPRRARPKKVGKWAWPASGRVLRRFNPQNASKGIDIAGRSGQPVQAAANGVVVYQGSGLRGYGQLIIIKHNPDYLSAYAHCSRILVKEGAQVKRGQKIAIMGSTGASRVKLHFEIRLRGNPVNPIRYLPRKS